MSSPVDVSGTVRERAARELRDRILTGALPAGSRIVIVSDIIAGTERVESIQVRNL